MDARRIRFQEREEETGDGVSVFPTSPQVWVHKGNSCIHVSWLCVAWWWGVVFAGWKESSRDNVREWGWGGAESFLFFFFFAVALNEILFGGWTQLGNIRTRRLCERVHTAVQKQGDLRVHEVFTTTIWKLSFCSLCLSVSLFTFLPPFFYLVFPLHSCCYSHFLLLHFFFFALCLLGLY